MKYLQYSVSNMAVTRDNTDRTIVTSGSVGYYGIELTFDEEFAEIAGTKAVEFYKDKHTYKRDLADGKVTIPKEVLKDAKGFDFRVISGSTVATSWATVGVTESGVIEEENPDTPAPAGYEYVKTPSGDEAVPYFRAGLNGLEYSTDGTNYVPGLEGLQDVPSTPSGQKYIRENGAWVAFDPDEAITEVQLNGTALTPSSGSVNVIVEGLQGTATQLEALDTDETDIPTIVAKINAIIGVLQSRGIATT